MTEDQRKTRAQLIEELQEARRQIAELKNAMREREGVDEKLRESEDKYRCLFESAVDAIFIMDVTEHRSHFLDCNERTLALFGCTHRDQIIGKSPADFSPPTQPDGRPSLEKIRDLAHAVIEGHSQHFEWEHVRSDGELFWVEVDLIRIQLQSKYYMQAVVRDITERKQAEEKHLSLERQVQQAQKLESLGVLAGGIAHDFNNLLMGVLGNADLALMDLAPEAPARVRITNIKVTAKRAADLTSQMLAYSGKGRFVVKNIDLQSLVEEMVHLLEVAISKKVVINYDFARNVPPVEADVTQVRQIVMNLVVNASEAVGNKSGVISIRTGAMECGRDYLDDTYLDDDLAENTYSYIEISDTGAGMDKETIARIFDPFFTTKFTGRGLGLAAVLGIVRGHKGAVKVDSEPGKGTTFKVLFPASRDTTDSSDMHPPAEISVELEGKTILLVDDEETVRTVTRQMLELLGTRVTTAEDGREALKLFRQDPSLFDCIILDLTMPHLDGEETFREMRRVRGDIRVLLSSGYNEQDLIARFAGSGFAGFIQKPYQTADIKQALVRALALKSR